MADAAKELAELVRDQERQEAQMLELELAVLAGADTQELERELGVGAELVERAIAPLDAAALTRMTAVLTAQLRTSVGAERTQSAPALRARSSPDRAQENQPQTDVPPGAWAPYSDAEREAADLDEWDSPSARRLVAVSDVVPAGKAGVLPFQRKSARRAWLWPAASALCVAAMLALWITRPQSTGSDLPEYGLEVRGSVSTDRAAPGGTAPSGQAVTPLALRPGLPLSLLLRPKRPVADAVEARVWLASPGAFPAPLSATVERGAEGTLKASIRLPAELPAQGVLHVLVGHPAALTALDFSTLQTNAEGPGWQHLARPFDAASLR